MRTHLAGIQSFFRFLHHFVLAKLATSSIRVLKLLFHNPNVHYVCKVLVILSERTSWHELVNAQWEGYLIKQSIIL